MSLAHDIDNVNRTKDVQVSEDVTFDSMLLSSQTLKGLKRSGFCYPSPIQLLGIPLGKCGFDLLLEAKSGTGKTAVFTIIILEKLNINNGLQALILAPTREIAFQICDVVKQIGKGHKGLNVEVVIGGLSVEEDIKKFEKNVHVVVGSPGRLKHLIQMKIIDVAAVRLLIIDEADKLMEKSFLADINYIFGILPAQKQVILSSATYPENYKQIISNYTKHFQHVCPDSDCVLKGVIQKVSRVKSNSNIVKQTQYRFIELLKILSKKQFKQCLIFCNYQARVTELHKMLTKEQWPVELLYSKQDQIDRLDALKTLQEYKCRILISTDLAARGIDASNVDLVINFEPPFEWQTYLHRVGRAGRFGSYGVAISILSEGQEVIKFRNLLKAMKSSISVQDFWTNKPFNLNYSETHTVGAINSLATNLAKVEISKDDVYSVLWNVLTQHNQNIKTIESFDKLLSTYDNCKEQSIQPFSDLIKSFNTTPGDENRNNASYQTIKINHLPTENLLSLLSSKNVLQSNVTNGHHNEKMDEVTVNSKNNCQQSNIPSKNSDIEEHCKKHDSIITSNNISQKWKGNDKEFNTEDCNKSMLDLGLPTSFSSKPRVDIKTNKSDKTSNRVNRNNIEFVESDTPYVSVHKKDSPKVTRNLSDNNNHSNNIKRTLPSNQTRHATKYNCNNHNSKQLQKMNNEHYYTLWYEQFKSHVKNIELSFYLNEISKL